MGVGLGFFLATMLKKPKHDRHSNHNAAYQYLKQFVEILCVLGTYLMR